MAIDYTRYLTSAHRSKPRFLETVRASVSGFSAVQDLLYSLVSAHAIDTAVGEQLDTLGLWIGQSRELRRPLDDVYFSWDDKVDTGWESGIWWDTYSPTEGITVLDDEGYRVLLKMQIAANHWNGNLNRAYEVWEGAFGYNAFVLVTDWQDMSIDIGFSGALPSTAKALIRSGQQPFKPESVAVRTYFTNNNDGPMFAWDLGNEALNGWDIGFWADEIING